MVAEQVDRLLGLAGRLLADRAGVPPLQREVLPDEHAELVGRLVQLGTRDVTVDAQQVETGVRGQRDVAAQVLRRRLGQRHACRSGVGALQEQPLTVDAERPTVHRHLTQSGAERSGVAGLVVDGHRHLELTQRLVAERARPPQLRVVHAEGPFDRVGALGQRVLQLPLDVAVQRRADPNRTGVVAVQLGPDHDVGAGRIGVAAQDAQAVDAHRPGPFDPHPAPQPARVPRGVHAVPVLEDPGQVALGPPVGRRAAGHLDGEHVLGAEAGQVRDLVRVREEVALRVPEVGTVEEDVGLVEDAVEHHPVAGPGRTGIELEAGAVEQRFVVGREGRHGPPVPWHRDGLPPVVVVVQTEGSAAQIVVGERGAPRAREVHRGSG